MRNPLLNQADDAMKQDDWALAEKLYKDCIEENENAEAIRELALIEYGFKKNSLKAKELIERSLQLNDSVISHFYLAIILDNLRIYPQAQEEFDYSLKESPVELIALINSMYADVLVAQERLEEAKLHFMIALSKEPDYEPAQRGYAKLLILLQSKNKTNEP